MYADSTPNPPTAAYVALSVCGDGGGIIGRDHDNDEPPSQWADDAHCGQVVIGLTNADGNFLYFAVDVVSTQLERANGDTVETLPERQRVDFDVLVGVTEFVRTSRSTTRITS